MKRSAYNYLVEWKNSDKRKPLILQGARQVGKTYLVNMLGENEYESYIDLNFEQDANLDSLFENTLNTLKELPSLKEQI